MYKFFLIVLMTTMVTSCTRTKQTSQDLTQSKPMTFKFSNDSLTQIMMINQINKDTLNVSLETINKIHNTKCSNRGLAIHDTIGDFLHEEETIEIENNEIIPVKYYTFRDTEDDIQLIIGLNNLTFDKLVFQGPDNWINSKGQTCLLKSIGTLTRQ